jgi:hypothetical protein
MQQSRSPTVADTRLPDLINLAMSIAICDRLLRDTGQERYALDCLVRHLLEAGWPGAIALGWQGDELKIEAGIGTLYLSATQQKWTPTVKGTPPPQPKPAPPDLVAIRQATCATCPRYESGRCQVAGCGCAGQGTPTALYSKCPLGLWPKH